ncbi:MAG TPA: flagellar hook capping FlgD N-terminal domain-containing protein [Aquabacterium sp.]|nr:flagellar hook capping FlgD N-terminal domain-containing protein [Aquabacterium sp.]
MTTTTATNTGTSSLDAYLASQSSSKSASGTTDATADRFLKLLVTQMQNQDPLNPMDNAQVTSQMAQINTVTGIDKLNTTVQNIGSNFGQMQLLQAANIVGHQVLVGGNQLNVASNGSAGGAYDLDASASNVTVDVLDGAGSVVDTIKQGAQDAGRHDFTWTPPSGTSTDQSFTFRITATSGSTTINSTPLMLDQVNAVSTSSSGGVNVELTHNGTTSYSQIKAVG